jgi:hypothetical protein
MGQKNMAEKFMFEKSGVERSRVEAWGWKVRVRDVLQPILPNCQVPNGKFYNPKIEK